MAKGKSVRLGDALRADEFRALWAAETISVAGDQLARVALALLVFDRTSSAMLSGLTYALTFVPMFLGGMLLSGVADRFPRRTVIIATDLVRAGLAASMAIPGLPLGVLWALVGFLTFASGPYKAAQLALLAQILEGDRYTAGAGLRQISTQLAQVVGFTLGGVMVVAFSPQGALLLNACTFLLSVALVSAWVRQRPASKPNRAAAEPMQAGQQISRSLVPVFVLAGMVGLWVVPEGLAAPYAEALGAAAFTVGLLMAADPVGSVVGGWLATRRVPAPTLNSLLLPAVLAGVPLAMCVLAPGVWTSAVLWALSGTASTVYLVRLLAYLAKVVPDHRRGMVMGRVSTCLQTSQGLAILAGGALAEVTGPFVAVAAAGGVSVLSVSLTALTWGRARPNGKGERPDDSSQMSLLLTATSPERLSPHDPAPGGAGQDLETEAHSV
jgi:MFS family permease